MITEYVRFALPPGITREQVEAGMRDVAPRWRRERNLIRKTFVLDPELRFTGAFYLWTDRASAEAAHDAAWRQRILDTYGSVPEIQFFDTPLVVDNALGRVVDDAPAPADRFDHLFIEPASFDAAVAFYRDGLGWTELFSWGSPGQPRGIGLDGGGTRLVLAEPHAAADRSKSHGIRGHQPTVHVVVGDLDARHAALRAKGLARFAPERTHWGTRWFVVEDPDGNLIAFEEGAPT